MSSTYIPKALRLRIAEEARHRCGYCLTQEVLVGYTIVESLKKVEGTPTRDAFLKSAKNLDITPPLLLPGITVKTSDSDPFPIEAMQISQFTGESFKLQGQVIQAST